MKKKFITKKKNHKSYKFLFLFFIFLTLMISIYQRLDKTKIDIRNKQFVKALLTDSNHHNKNNFVKEEISKLKKYNLVSLLNNNYKKMIIKDKIKRINDSDLNNSDPIIYLYNTHQTEEYSASNYVEYSLRPTVQMVNYILEDYFNTNNYKTLVEERKIKDILNINKWNYSYSYKASRIYMEDSKQNNPKLKYFIDIHRDSLSREKTTIKIENKNYAKLLFIVGLENNNYKENLEFVEKINSVLNTKYPGLSKGIYKKGGEGVNGVYNQDFSEYTILVEIGGKDNTIEEVLNTSLAFSKCFIEVISNDES